MGHQSPFKSSKGPAKLKNRGSGKKQQSLILGITSDSLWSDIQEFAKLKYQVLFGACRSFLVAFGRSLMLELTSFIF